MIDAKEALAIADTEVRSLGWGEITPDDDDYEAMIKSIDGRAVWSVRRKGLPVRGCSYSFIIDAETGELMASRRYGTR